ncbi:MAG: hypothetical protein AAF797_12480 [Planctomycetota bacterium]
MPVYLFTYHAYASWMPDHPRGYVHRTQGLKKTDREMAAAYRAKQRESRAVFDRPVQEVVVATAREAASALDAKLYGVATDRTHVHVLLSWEHEQAWKSMRRSVRYAMTLALNRAICKRTWFSEQASRKRVKGHDHFDYLLLAYLPDHRGVGWYESVSVEAAERRDGQRGEDVVARFERLKRRRLARRARRA